MIFYLNPAYSDGVSGAALLKLFGVQTAQGPITASTSSQTPSVSVSSKTAASSNTIQAILDAAAEAKMAGEANLASGVQSTYADGTWDGFVQYGTPSSNSYAADTTQVAPGTTITTGHNPPVQVRDPYYQNNYTMAQAEHNFYETFANGAYNTLHALMDNPGENVAAFDQAFQNQTLTFTPTSDIAGLQYSSTTFLDYDSSGQVDGGGSTTSLSGGASLDSNPNEFISGNYGYKGAGATAGFVISW